MPNDTTSKFAARKRLIVASISACFASTPAWANPTGPQMVNGAASFNQAGKLLSVTNTNGAIINWNSFSIAKGETTRFYQASAASSVLNRVVANDPSVLLGTLSSNGKVWLVNPAGIMVGQGAKIDVAGLIASTLNVRNEDFLAGRLNFGATPNAGSIQNYGQIATPSGGSVLLVAPNVENHGIINAPNGEVILAAGQTAQLIDTGTPGVKVDIAGAEGSVTNLGRIISEAGRIGMAGVLVKNSGTLNASSVVKEGGRIFLKASKDAYVDGAGRVAATGTKGGSIEVLGNRVAVMDRAQLDASGDSGGGTVLVGGDFEGKNPEVQNARVIYFGRDASIKVDAAEKGDGGKVIVWADDTTRAFGAISAKGGIQSGDGGFVETSGHRFLDVAGIKVNAGAAHGKPGHWLLDPSDITIVSGSAGSLTSGLFDPPDPSASIGATEINDALDAGTSVTLQTSGGSGGNGDITLSGSADSGGPATIVNSAGGTRSLMLKADRSILINPGASIVGSSGNPLNVALFANASGSGGSITMLGSSIISHGGNITLAGGLGGAGSAAGTATNISGIHLDGVTIDAAGGNIALRGTGVSGSNSANGIHVTNAGRIETLGAGTITLNGTGGAGTDTNRGVYIDGAGTTVTSVNGDIAITGHGAGTGVDNRGIYLSGGAKVAASGAGNVTLDGTGSAAGTNYNYGVYIKQSGTEVSAASGAVSITGHGAGSGTDNYGVHMYDFAKVAAAGSGDITLIGTGGASTGSYNMGVYISDSSMISATGSGTIALNGTGGSSGTAGGSNRGVRVSSGASISANSGNIAITGTGAYNGDGVQVAGGAHVQSASGAITLHGTVVDGDSNNAVYVTDAGTLVTTGGNISITGNNNSGTGGGNRGVAITSSAQVVATGAGTITVTGHGGYEGDGLHVHGGALVQSGTGLITLSGTSGDGAGTNWDWGVEVGDAGTLVSSGGGMTITGISTSTDSAGNTHSNYGLLVRTGAKLTTSAGLMTLNGTNGAGTTSDAVRLSGTPAGGVVNAAAGLAINGTGDVVVDTGSIINVGTGNANISATNNILFSAGSSLAPAAGVFNIALNADSNGTGGGGIYLDTGSSINSNGGNIIMGGMPSVGYAVGNGSVTGGITFRGGITVLGDITAGAGDVTMRGEGASSGSHHLADGIMFGGGLLSSNGTVIIDGKAHVHSDTTAGTEVTAGVDFLGGGTRLSTQTGTVTITGLNSAPSGSYRAQGITIGAGTVIETTGSGTLTLNGTSTSLDTAWGVGVFGGTIQTTAAGGGAIAINGTNTANPDGGVVLQDGHVLSGGGAINITGESTDSPVGFINTAPNTSMLGGPNSGAISIMGLNTGTIHAIGAYAGVVDAGAANLTFSGAAIDLTNLTLQGSGSLILQPVNPAATIGVAGGSGAFNLSTTSLGFIQPGFSNITIGRSDGTGAIEVGAHSWSDSVSLRNPGAGANGITVSGATSLAAGKYLKLASGGAISINNSITGAGVGSEFATPGSLTVNGTVGAGSVVVNADRFTLSGGTWNQVSTTLPAFTVNDFRITGGTFIRALGGDGASTSTPYRLADIYGVQGMGSAGMLSKSYVLANSIDATGTANWNGGSGFKPVGDSASPFAGTFNGGGYSISNLAINRPYQYYVGLFGNNSGTIDSVSLTGVNISGGQYVGALAGRNSGTVSDSSATGVVDGGEGYAGGLVGYNSYGGSVTGSAAAVTVSNSYYYPYYQYGGGLIGYNAGSISNSYATGSVNSCWDGSCANYSGGLVGYNSGSISNSYATGSVTACDISCGDNVGGLVGYSGGSISNAYATGRVHGGSYVGGLVGYDYYATVSNSYATGSVTAYGSYGGGLVGYVEDDSSNTITNAYATGSVTGSFTGSNFVGGLVGINQWGTFTDVYATGTVTVAGTGFDVGGLVGNNYFGTVNNGYWNSSVNPSLPGIASGATTGATGLSTADMMRKANFTGWDIADYGGSGAVWRIYEDRTTPLLSSFLKPVTVTANDGSKVYDKLAFAGNGVTSSVAGATLSGTPSYSYSDASMSPVEPLEVASYMIKAAGLFSHQQGYDISYASGTLTITARPLTVAADAKAKIYGEVDPALTYVVGATATGTGLVTGDILSGSLTRIAGETVLGGPYAINQGSLSAGSNYALSYTGANLAITARPLTVMADAKAKVYGEVDPTLTYTYNVGTTGTGTGLLSGDGIVGNLARAAGETVLGGPYAINQGSVSAGSNYASSYAGANLAITARPLTITAVGQNKVYDAINNATVTLGDNRLGSDVLTLAYGSAAFNDKNVGVAKPVNVSGIALSGTDAGNYSFNVTATTSADITPATLSLSGVSAANKVYDATTSATLSGGSLSGVFGSDVVGVSGTGVFADTSVPLDGKNVGTGKTVNLSSFTLTGADAGNYVLSGGTALTTADITLRPLSTWIGGASGNWSVASNWDALPDLSNVQSVSVPAGTTVTYDAAAGSTRLASLSAGGLTLAGGSLNIADGLKVSSSFSLSGGTLGFGSAASADITQASGNLTMPAATLANLALAAPAGAITQSGAIVATNLKTQSQTGTTLTDAGNKVANFTAANSGNGNIAFTNTAVLTLGDVSNSGGNISIDNTGAVTTIGAVSAPAGAVSILAHSPLTIGTGGVTAAGNITLSAGESPATSDQLTLNGAVQSTGSGSAITLFAGDDLAQNANVTANGGAVNATAQLGNISMALGTTTSAGGGNIGYTATSGSVILASLNAGSGGIALNAGKSIQAVPGFTGANLISRQAAIVAGGDLNLLTQVTKLDVDVGGKFTITDVLTGTVMSDVPAAEPLPTSSVPVLEQVLSTVTNTTEQQQPGQTTTQPPPPPPPPPAGGSGPNLLSGSSQTIGGTEGTFGGSAGASSSSGSSGAGGSGQGSGASSGTSGDKPPSDKPAGDKPSESKTDGDKSASAKTDEGKDGDKKDDKKEDDKKKKEEESTAKKDDKPAPKKLATCS